MYMVRPENILVKWLKPGDLSYVPQNTLPRSLLFNIHIQSEMPKTTLNIFTEWTKNSRRAHRSEVSDNLDKGVVWEIGLEVEGVVS